MNVGLGQCVPAQRRSFAMKLQWLTPCMLHGGL
jgi:hypothetical protein